MFNLDKRIALIAVFCGLTTAVLVIAFYGLFASLAAVPLFVAALGFGTSVGLLAGAVAAIAITILLGPAFALIIVVLSAGPAIWIGHLAGLVNEDGEWFPASGIFLRMAGISAAVGAVLASLLASDPEVLRQALIALLAPLLQTQTEAGLASEAEDLIDRLVAVFPAVIGSGLLITLVVNLLLGERIARARNWVLRPKDIKAFDTALPTWAVPLLAVTTIIAAYADSAITAPALAVAGAFGMGFSLIGLATIHAFARTMASRVGLLIAVYFFVLFLNPFSLLLLALLGVAETLFSLRLRVAPTTPSI